MPELSDGVIAILSALFGGGGLKMIEHFLLRGKRKQDDAAQLRNELRADVDGLRKEVKDLRTELREEETQSDLWKHKYYEKVDEYGALLAAYKALEEKAKSAGIDIPVPPIASTSLIDLIEKD